MLQDVTWIYKNIIFSNILDYSWLHQIKFSWKNDHKNK